MHTLRRRPALAALLTLALAVPLAATVSPAVAAPASSVRINEVESDGGTPGDWIELTNIGAAPVDISGYVLKDNNNDRTLAIANGTILEAGGFFVADVDGKGETNFGLGKADMARVYLPDGSTLVDSYEWSAHAATTWGRCADGTGDFRLTEASTRGEANACEVSLADNVRINEIESSGGSPDDWIELTNIGNAAVDVSGLVIKDSEDDHVAVLPTGSTINAGGFLVVEAPVLSFGLGGADSARLFESDGTTSIDSYSWSAHAAGTTYGRCPDGIGDFATTQTSTKGAANDCVAPVLPNVRINEVESSGGIPEDWVELLNTGSTDIDLTGYTVLDNDPTHTPAVIPTGTVIAAGGFFVVESAVLGFGLGAADSVNLIGPDGFTVVDTVSWTSHATTSYGICADGSELVTMTSVTKGAANDCGSPVRVNEIESSGGTPGDWIELKNNGVTTADVSGFVLKDSADDHAFVLPAESTIGAGAYLVINIEEGPTGFGLGGGDAVRLFAADGSTLVDSYVWTAHATTTYGRCADGTGEFTTTVSPTRGAANACEGDLVTSPWPGSPAITTADTNGTLGGNMSGLAYEAGAEGDVLWAAKNGTGSLFRLISDGSNWVSDTANNWGAGKALHYTNGTGDVDAEGVTLTDAGAIGEVFIASERNNSVSGTSRPAVLRYDVLDTGSELTAEMEWNLTADLPAVAANSGLEAISWLSDEFLVDGGLLDESTNAAYDPALYPDHGDGLFFVGLEANGTIYAYALNQLTGAYNRVATIASGFAGVMDLEFEAESSLLWAVCDDTCEGRSAVLEIAQDGVNAGKFAVTTVFERPASMPNLNNEGFAIAPQDECVAGAKTVFWADDSNTDGFALRTGSIDCTAPVTPTPTDPPAPTPTDEPTTPPTPEPVPSDEPTNAPTPTPTAMPTAVPTSTPTVEPTAAPIPVPTDEPTTAPIPTPTDTPTAAPTPRPTAGPTTAPTPTPSTTPAPAPTTVPTATPTTAPVPTPGDEPTDIPSATPTATPTTTPTTAPSDEPTPVPSDTPSTAPTAAPPAAPTAPPTAAPTEAPTAPVAVPSESLTDEARGPVSSPATAIAGGSVTVTIGDNHAGESVNVWLHSTPRLLASTVVSAENTVTVTIPADAETGAHRIAVVAADGTLIGWDNIVVTAAADASSPLVPVTPATGTLANTGIDTTMAIRLAVLLLLLGAVVLVIRHKRRSL